MKLPDGSRLELIINPCRASLYIRRSICAQPRCIWSQAHGEFSEEELHQTARMIVAALQARIHTVEWTPALLNNKVLNISMHNNWCVCTQKAEQCIVIAGRRPC